jgi:hypothetical protein
VAAPNDALTYAKRFVGSLPVDDSALIYRLLDDAHKEFWMFDNWSWTVGLVETVALVNNTQDYNLVGSYTDFAFLLYIRLITSDTNQITDDLKVTQSLPVSTLQYGQPKRVSYIAGSPNKLRVLPIPLNYSSLPSILGYYKKKPTAISNSNYTNDYATSFGIPDFWFQVYQEMVLLKAYLFTRDPRAGTIQVNNGQLQYTGQFGVVMEALNFVKATEKKIFDNFGQEIHNG